MRTTSSKQQAASSRGLGRAFRFVLVGLIAAFALIGIEALRGPQTASAHPLGNFTINRLAKVQLLSGGEVRLRYVVDMAEIPAFQEIRKLDRDGDGTISDAESAAYLQNAAPELMKRLDLRIGGDLVQLRAGDSALSTPQGQGGLSTLRLVLDFLGSAPGDWQAGADATFRDGNYTDRLGWRDVVVLAGEGVALTHSSASPADETAELTWYPEARLKSPPAVHEVRFRFQSGDSSTPTSPLSSPSNSKARKPVGKTLDRFAGLVDESKLTPAFIALSLLAAAAWGAAHALGPGHGKTIVAAYLVGSRGTARHALVLGLTVTATHTSSVFALGLVTLSASSLIDAQDLYLWLSVGSGLMVVAMGAGLFVTRLRTVLTGRVLVHSHPEHGHEDEVAIGPFDGAQDKQASNLATEHGHSRVGHTHGHDDHHEHAGNSHSPDHEHGHSHLPTQPGWRGLIALGISGGLLPCPTALVVMLGAIALDRTAYGLALVVAFSVGLAGVLTGIGLLLVYARRLLEGTGRRVSLFSPSLTRRAVAALPVLSSLGIFVAGLIITSSALAVV